jgi:hypothetical protein
MEGRDAHEDIEVEVIKVSSQFNFARKVCVYEKCYSPNEPASSRKR